VAVLGNSITDGRGSGTNKQNRWPDILSECLLKNKGTQQVGVLNLGIGGNCVLKNCLGPSALDRFERDILKQQGVRWLIILEAINDIGQTPDSVAATLVAKKLIAAYELMIEKAHTKGIKVYGATILPFGKSFYYKPYRESARNTVNEWIRTSGRFDAVIDFDKALRNPEDTLNILPTAHSGDFLHPNETGYKMMGESIDLKLFE
jgi:lysophospholipase L1-like esterase